MPREQSLRSFGCSTAA